MPSSTVTAYRIAHFGVFELDLRSGELRNRGIRVRLQEKPFEVLSMLLETPGELVTREQLFEKVWAAHPMVELDRSLAVAINKIRQALNDNAASPRFIQTIPRRGFRFIAPVRKDRTDGKSLLMVLPFENLTKASSQDYLVDGLTEETISQLGRVNPHRLGVIARHTAMTYKRSSKSLADIGAELKLDYLVVGSVRRTQNYLKITVELVKTSDQSQLWTQTYERSLKQMTSVHSEVAREIAECLALELVPQQRSLIAKVGTHNQLAYEMYLQGRYLWAGRTDAAMHGAIGFFEKAISSDPEYAIAYTGMADCYGVLGYYGSIPPQEAFSKAKMYSTKALSINNHLAEAHASLAFALLQHEWNWSSAEREHLFSLQLNSNCSSAQHWYGIDLTQVGRLQEAEAVLQRALSIDPLSVAVRAHIARVFYFQRKFEKAADGLLRAIHLDESYAPAKYFLALVLIQQRKYAEAIATLEGALRIDSTHPILLASLAFAHSRQGNHHAAEVVAYQLRLVSRKRRVDPFFRAFALLESNRARAISFLRHAYEERFGWLLYVPIDPAFDGLRSEPDFASLVTQLSPITASSAAAH
ncbi:MAG TPA: winged helix-turn-helix domain-containing protein [Terriglobales bacterium]|nr:winged helix-turn-helix domain-containing protein [Terriglobales bacterium]